MLIGQIIAYDYDIGCGTSVTPLGEKSFNIKQLQEIAEKLNKKHGRSSEVDSLKFIVDITDTKKVKDSLSRNDISNLWK